MNNQFQPTARSKVRTLAKRAVKDVKPIHEILDAHFLCFVGFNRRSPEALKKKLQQQNLAGGEEEAADSDPAVSEESKEDLGTPSAAVSGCGHIPGGGSSSDAPIVLPTCYTRQGEYILLHGKATSGLMRHIAAGFEVCITVALVDGLVCAKAAMHHSANYRSVVIFGSGELIKDPAEKKAAFEYFTDRVTYRGRAATLRPISDAELKATSIVRIPLKEVACKIRDAGVSDDAADLNYPCWAGIVPLVLTSLPPVSSPHAKNFPIPLQASYYSRSSQAVIPVKKLFRMIPYRLNLPQILGIIFVALCLGLGLGVLIFKLHIGDIATAVEIAYSAGINNKGEL